MLKLRTLHLDGFLSYDKAVIPLDKEGITFIQGDTGAGKSTIFEAILYLLYGKTLRKRSSVNDLENKVLNAGYEIALEFSIDDVDYIVKEVRSRKKADGLFFFINGDDSREKTDVLTRDKIKRIVGISDEEFKNLVFLGQRQSQKFIDGTSGERAQLLTELFGLEKYDVSIEKIEHDLKSNTILKEQAERSTEDIDSNIKELGVTIANHSELLPVDDSSIATLVSEVVELETEIRRLRFDELKNKELLGKIDVVQKNTQKLAVLTEQIDNLQSQIDAVPPAKYSHEELLRLLNKCRNKYTLITQEIDTKEAEFASLATCGNICPISNEECALCIPQQYKEVREEAAQKGLETLSAQFDDVSAKLATVERAILKSNDLVQIEQDLANKQHIFSLLQAATVDLGDVNIDNVKSNLAFFAQKITLCDTKIREKSAVLNELKTQKCLYEQNTSHKASLLALLDNKVVQLAVEHDKIAALTNKIQYLSTAVSIFKKLKLYKIDLILDRINFNVQEQLDKISEALKINFSSLRKGSKGKTLDQLNITVLNNGVSLPIEMLSGGQTTQLGLALLLGIYKTAFELSEKGVNMLFLDEAFGTLSDDIIDGTFESIISLTKELGFNNVKIISHRDLDSRRFDSIWSITRINGLSSLTIVN